MKLRLNNRILLIILVVVILAIGIFFLYSWNNSNSNSKKIEPFAPFNRYSPVNIGDPITNNIDDSVVVNSQNRVLSLDQNQNIIRAISDSKSKLLNVVCSTSSFDILICSYDNKINRWNCLFTEKTQNNIPQFTKINPSTTLPAMNNNKICTRDSSILFANNSKSIFFYNEPYNIRKKINCLYYWSNSPENIKTLELNCLSLPKIENTTTNANGNLPPLSYDKMNFICANDNVLIGLSCSNILYYLILDANTKAPAENSIWQKINIANPNIIKFIVINDYAIYIL